MLWLVRIISSNGATLNTSTVKRHTLNLWCKAENRCEITILQKWNNNAHWLCMKQYILWSELNLLNFRWQVPLEIIERAVLMFKALLISQSLRLLIPLHICRPVSLSGDARGWSSEQMNFFLACFSFLALQTLFEIYCKHLTTSLVYWLRLTSVILFFFPVTSILRSIRASMPCRLLWSADAVFDHEPGTLWTFTII